MLVPKTMLDCVCFVCTYIDNKLTPVGTAFFPGVPVRDSDPQKWVGFAVTALHVISGIEASPNTAAVDRGAQE